MSFVFEIEFDEKYLNSFKFKVVINLNIMLTHFMTASTYYYTSATHQSTTKYSH